MSDTTTTPIQGKRYLVKKGDRITRISSAAYGTESQANLIVQANNFIQGRPISLEGFPTIYAGDILKIPVSPDEQKRRDEQRKTLPNKQPGDVTLLVNGKTIEGFNSFRFLSTMDTASDAVSGVLGVDIDDDETWNLFRAYLYPEMKLYIGGVLRMTGRIYKPETTVSNSGRSVSFTGYSKTIDIVDSCIKPPYEFNDIDLESLSKQILQPFGLSANFQADSGGNFDRLTCGESETAYSFLAKPAKQRGLLISSNDIGELLFWKADTSSPVIGTIEEEFPPASEFSASYDGRARFQEYRAISQDEESNAINAVSQDKNVPIYRLQTFSAPDSTTGNIQSAADWQRSKAVADALTLPFPVSSWYGPDGNIWRENTRVVVKSKTIYCPDGFTFLIRNVELRKENGGQTAVLSLVPPSVYTGEEIIEPWA